MSEEQEKDLRSGKGKGGGTELSAESPEKARLKKQVVSSA
jgi:hypothetical protein